MNFDALPVICVTIFDRLGNKMTPEELRIITAGRNVMVNTKNICKILFIFLPTHCIAILETWIKLSEDIMETLVDKPNTNQISAAKKGKDPEIHKETYGKVFNADKITLIRTELVGSKPGVLNFWSRMAQYVCFILHVFNFY